VVVAALGAAAAHGLVGEAAEAAGGGS
jgi:hypothetical protein